MQIFIVENPIETLMAFNPLYIMPSIYGYYFGWGEERIQNHVVLRFFIYFSSNVTQFQAEEGLFSIFILTQ